jgi:hypothetical protein
MILDARLCVKYQDRFFFPFFLFAFPEGEPSGFPLPRACFTASFQFPEIASVSALGPGLPLLAAMA